ncbi:MAG: hypothetical protein LBD12_02010 [Clostridiales Family XIII bacterium]|jgi:hypothetical protein|nr:hypothetical protein [Clostridiales Family XIII bacterium]
MAITLANLVTRFIPLLDLVYAAASVTNGLTGDPALAQAGSNARRIKIPKLTMSGLGDYSRANGYVDGDVTVTWEEVEFNYDRGRKFIVDAMDNDETFNIAFGRLAAEFIRTKVAPEADAFTFAQIAGTPGIQTATPATYADGAAFLAALLKASTELDEAEVPAEQRHLFVTPTLLNSVKALDTTRSREALQGFAHVVSVPQTRFYTAVEMLDGETAGEEAGHFQKAASGKDINFMVVHKPALIKFDKHVINSVITPEQNQTHDAYGVKYRKYGIVDTYENKAKGIYLSNKA